MNIGWLGIGLGVVDNFHYCPVTRSENDVIGVMDAAIWGSVEI